MSDEEPKIVIPYFHEQREIEANNQQLAKYKALKQQLVNCWTNVFTAFDKYDASYFETRMEDFKDFGHIHDLLLSDPTSLTEFKIASIHESIHRLLQTKTSKYMLAPPIHAALTNFQRQVESAGVVVCKEDDSEKQANTILADIRKAVGEFLSLRQNKNGATERHGGLSELNKIDDQKLAKYDSKDAAFYLMVKKASYDRLQNKFNIFKQITRNKDVAEFYRIFNETPLFETKNDNDFLTYNIDGLNKVLTKLQEFNQNLSAYQTQTQKQVHEPEV